MSITAMKLALEALAAMTRIHTEPAGFDGKYGKALTEFIGLQEKKIAAALASAESGIEALRTAITEAESVEPVQWQKRHPVRTDECDCHGFARAIEQAHGIKEQP